jgi:predicted DsbA family dithiol-disulfide isomerase
MKALMEEEGLPYSAGRTMTYNSRLAQELAKWAESRGKGDEIHGPLFRAYFVDGKNLARSEVLTEIAAGVGLPAGEAAEIIAGRGFKDAVEADWKRCGELRVDGVPTFVMNDRILVGARPYEDLERLVLMASAAGRS